MKTNNLSRVRVTPFNLSLIFSLIILSGCSHIVYWAELFSPRLKQTLALAGANRQELEEVLIHYRKEGVLSEKFRAALFLLENMAEHESYQLLNELESVFDSASTYDNDQDRKHVYKAMLDQRVKQLGTGFRTVRRKDVQVLRAEDLIQNIDEAYDAWMNIHVSKRADFDDFCEFILPYKCNNEPIEIETRKVFRKTYGWVVDSLENGVSLDSTVLQLMKAVNFQVATEVSQIYPIPLSASQSIRSKFGLCDDGVNLLVSILRSVGLVASRESIPQWGNSASNGHSWFSVAYGGQERAFNISGANYETGLRSFYSSLNESVPKVYRKKYSSESDRELYPHSIDVTHEYTKTYDVQVDNPWCDWSNSFVPVVSVFNFHKEWEPVDIGEWNGSQFKFSDLGPNVLYLPGILTSSGMVAVNFPFFINADGRVEHFRVNLRQKDSLTVLRKYGLTVPRYRADLQWFKNIEGGEFQASNFPDFRNYTVLHKIESCRSTHPQRIETNNQNVYKYMRFYTQTSEPHLFQFVAYKNSANQKIKGSVINPKNEKLPHSAWITQGLELRSPQPIPIIEYMVRNDENHIVKQDDYELFYWDVDMNSHQGQWVSWDRQRAQDTVLYYQVPSNTLFWLKNHSRGKEEHVFTVSASGKQRWLGFDNYN
ncbi:hypothetical protein [Marinoscillum furvescens]|uniref:Peptide-N(4)-(N-acetyl-beta-glucosaminyl)asparagine amidase n=1 Tax=Marinoscillum furvescens DSM 4134 TaxID=1122208 RepID=A0A3D9L308_MARFU|nr:hypothetical protein [Marinoscillum furvescens]RED98396.1 hypothetical protein C7460_11068 [Marinoscillum furvescens DSM 4134]